MECGGPSHTLSSTGFRFRCCRCRLPLAVSLLSFPVSACLSARCSLSGKKRSSSHCSCPVLSFFSDFCFTPSPVFHSMTQCSAGSFPSIRFTPPSSNLGHPWTRKKKKRRKTAHNQWSYWACAVKAIHFIAPSSFGGTIQKADFENNLNRRLKKNKM